VTLVLGGNIHYYACGHTSRGFVSLLDSSLQDIRTIYLIRGEHAFGASDFMREFGRSAASEGEEVWVIHSPFLRGGIDGIVMPESRMAVIAESGLRGEPLRCPDADIRSIDWTDVYDKRRLADREEELARLREAMEQSFSAAYARFAEALRVHDDWERIYITNLDKQATVELAARTAERMLGNARRPGRQTRTFLRFLGAATPDGARDFVPRLTKGLKRYLLKGRPGSGKSTLLGRVAAEAASRGFDTEIYRCGFDPASLDMVIVRELGVTIFDSTAPHEYFPERESDEIIDMYETCIRPGTDETFAGEIAALSEAYKTEMKEAIGHLARARSHFDRIVQIYAGAFDYISADLLKSDLRQEWSKRLSLKKA
jgi:hypothetical protein